MVGILLVTHNGLGNSLLDCVRHVTGKVPAHLKSVAVLADDDTAQKEAEIRTLLQQLDHGDGVLILTDLYGATPCNIARRACLPGRVEGMAGVNLPMLLRVACGPDVPLPLLLQRAQQGGQDCIVPLTADLAGCNVCAD